MAYNLTGFMAYGFFNIGMYWIESVKVSQKVDTLVIVHFFIKASITVTI